MRMCDINFIFVDKKGRHMTGAGTYQFCVSQIYLSKHCKM